MGSTASGLLSWNLSEVAAALKMSEDAVREYFTDGRRVSFLLERRIAKEVIKGELAPNEGAGYDLIDPGGGRWEVRSISSRGIYFCPSYMVGSKRSFEEPGFLAKLNEIEGYIVSDIEGFPVVPYWTISSKTVRNWYEDEKLGAGTKLSRARILKLLQP